MKTYYVITTCLTFYINMDESKTPFIQSIAENLMLNRGFGCDDYRFSTVNTSNYKGINLTDVYNNYYLEFYS